MRGSMGIRVEGRVEGGFGVWSSLDLTTFVLNFSPKAKGPVGMRRTT